MENKHLISGMMIALSVACIAFSLGYNQFGFAWMAGSFIATLVKLNNP